ncbi:MAG TPA: phosphoenolpyruvate--protein phosphotransferase [Anaerolineaceae bacterium]|nr:phosphoenolpyruvate--protein phosphotransferase [Anaerolineaceae bacterium]
MKSYQGVGISAGIAIGPVFRYETETIVVQPEESSDPNVENKRLEDALQKATRELEEILEKARKDLATGSNEAEIFDAHLMLLSDPDLLDQVKENIYQQSFTAEYAWYKATEYYAELIGAMDSEYLAARSADIKDVAQRVLRHLVGDSDAACRLITIPSVVVAKDLTPSDTVSFDKSKVLGFCTISGGPTSHVAILSKALGIPAVVGIGPWMDELTAGREVVVDGFSGKMILDPDQATIKKYKQTASLYEESFKKALESTKEHAITKDGRRVEVVANIGGVEDAKTAVEFGAEGVGLLRTEFIFLERETAPTEEEQVQVYKDIFAQFGSNPVVTRTLDIGGDKPANYLKIPEEMNPFLGLRGTRLALARPEVFHTQLRALMRAGIGCNLKVMFPMVGTVQEVRDVMSHVNQVKKDLATEGVPFEENIEWGIMIEIPAAAVMADALAKEVDFFSIGTNDLSQYTLAADRGNTSVVGVADAFDPSVLRLIKMVVEAAHANKKWVGLCGELAGDGMATPVLLGIGIDEFSMNPRAIPLVKQSIRRFSMATAREIADHALGLATTADVRYYLKSFL